MPKGVVEIARKVMVDLSTGEGHFVKSERFVKTMMEVWRYMNRQNVFTAAEEKTLHRLSMFLQLNTNALVSPGGNYMNIERMAYETGIDRSNIRKAVKVLIGKNALGMWRSGENEIYYMNPFLYQMGEVQPFLFSLFDTEYHRRCKIDHNLKAFRAGKKVTSILINKPSKTAV